MRGSRKSFTWVQPTSARGLVTAIVTLCLVFGCEQPAPLGDAGKLIPSASGASSSASTAATGAPSRGPQPAAAIAHGGVGSPPERVDGCRRAVDAALAKLAEKGDPVAAAVAGVEVLEDDPRFNAGTGSRVRIDG